ncbi:ferric reductase-like transmembrane domain-containing protein [Actinomadura sp. SCN-SB]|uniref:ferric reductase-like transmembrane domain-containing protein n=1 Tax=Actinomadura sp. SCN-SB TaxID=3373092 RepID=UPI0037530FC0
MSIKTATPSPDRTRTLGANRSWRRRLLRHHLPLALGCGVLLVLFMGLSPFITSESRTLGDIFGGTFPADSPGLAGQAGRPNESTGQVPFFTLSFEQGGAWFLRQSTTATGYVATVLLGLTLLIGPANLLLRKRNPVSNYLRRDAGAWTAIVSAVHVVLGFQVHAEIINYFFRRSGGLQLSSFGLANWTGLAALLIVLALLSISTDGSMRELKAKRWKHIQRLNYALFALVVLHAFFYGALLRASSLFTLILILTVAVVLVGQVVGIGLWRRRYARSPKRAQPA